MSIANRVYNHILALQIQPTYVGGLDGARPTRWFQVHRPTTQVEDEGGREFVGGGGVSHITETIKYPGYLIFGGLIWEGIPDAIATLLSQSTALLEGVGRLMVGIPEDGSVGGLIQINRALQDRCIAGCSKVLGVLEGFEHLEVAQDLRGRVLRARNAIERFEGLRSTLLPGVYGDEEALVLDACGAWLNERLDIVKSLMVEAKGIRETCAALKSPFDATPEARRIVADLASSLAWGPARRGGWSCAGGYIADNPNRFDIGDAVVRALQGRAFPRGWSGLVVEEFLRLWRTGEVRRGREAWQEWANNQ